MPLRVRNVSGTGGDRPTCGCGSWLAHWENNTGSRRRTCMAVGCANPIEVGAHVRVVGGPATVYIVGLCLACNIHHNRDPFQLDSRSGGVDRRRTTNCG
jgi:hypothetical protein